MYIVKIERYFYAKVYLCTWMLKTSFPEEQEMRWKNGWMKMDILITGINGFVGKNFAERLLNNENVTIVGIDIQEENAVSNLEYYQIDITEPFFLDRHFDFIFHFAALSRTNVNTNYSYSEIYDINVNGTVNTIKSCTFDKIVFLSSALLYEKNSRYIFETSPLQLNSYYSKTKYEAEGLIKKMLKKEQAIVLRPVNLAGENQELVAAIPVFFWQAINNQDIKIFVPRNKLMQFLHVDDFTDLLYKLLYQDIHGLFNVSSQETIRIIDLAEKIIQICNSNSKIICSNTLNDLPSVIDSGRIRRLLNWEAVIGIDEILIKYEKALSNRVHAF